MRLAPIGDPDLVATAIAQALGLQMTGPTAPDLLLRAYLEEKHLLLLLDNFEHLVEAAPLVDDLLRRCPWLHVLVTSRQPLRVRGERQTPVLPLALPVVVPGADQPTAVDVLRYSAVALFAERAEAVQPDFIVSDGNAAAVAELCRRLDGLPLAIELVAARIKLLPPAELVARLRGPWLLSMDGLRDVSARQKTLRGAISWSYDLLNPAEQTLLTRLAVFAGGCTLEAAEILCEDVLPPAQVLDGIASLLDKSLLHRETDLYGELRYAMLETVREYGFEQLAAQGQELAMRERHVRCFLRLIEIADQTDLDPAWIRVRRLVGAEIHNMRAALAWAMQHDVQAALLLVTALTEWAAAYGPFAEGLQMIDDVFALPGASAHPIPRAKALFKAGILLLWSGQISKAHAFEEESLALSQMLGYGKGEADALFGLGRVAHTGWWDQEAAQRYFDGALACYRMLKDSSGIAYATALLGEIPYWQGDFAQARMLLEESLAVARQAGFSWAYPGIALGHMALTEGDLDRAEPILRHALSIVRRHGGAVQTVNALTNLGIVACRRSDFAAAHAFFDEATAAIDQIGNRSALHIVYLPLADLYTAEGHYGRAIHLCRQCWTGMESARTHWASYLLSLAALAEAIGQHELVARLLGTAEAVGDTAGFPLFPDERKASNRLVELARTRLDAANFDAAWARGQEQEFQATAIEAVSILETTLGVQDGVSGI